MTGHAQRGSVWLHALAAAVVLGVCALASDPGTAYLSDEGAAILQARQLSAGDAWVYENPLPDIDPNGDAMPFPQGDEGAKGRAPYAKHPLYPRLLQAAHGLGGAAGYLILSIVGTLLAALAAASTARRVRATLAIPVLWAVALSPLFFDSFIVLAHTLAAAAAAGAVFALTLAVETTGRRRWLAVAALFVGCGLAAALRSEGVFVGIGCAGAALLIGVRRVGLARSAPAVVAATAGSASVWLAEGAFQRATLGRGTQGLGADRVSSVSGRLDGFVSTWLLPGDRPLARVAFLLVAGMALVGVGALLARMGRRDALVATVLVVGAAGYVARLVVGDPHPVPGLLVAFPLGLAGAFLLRRADLASIPAAVGATAAAVIAIGVLLSQYAVGGSVEWGGRYFAVAVPLAAVALVAALARTWSETDWAPVARRGAATALAVATLTTAGLAIATLRDSHHQTKLEARAVERAGARAGPARVGRPGDERPIVVTTESLVPQLLWPVFARYRWLVVEHHELAGVLELAARARVARLVLLTADPTPALDEAAPWYRPEPASGPAPPVPVIVLNSR